MNGTLLHRVHIIESPSPEDFLSQRCEGSALAEALTLAGIEVKKYSVIDEPSLDSCLQRIPVEAAPDCMARVPYLHFSAHGNNDGIELSDHTFVPWERLGKKLYKLNQTLGGVGPTKPSLVVLCMSTCKGVNAVKMTQSMNLAPFAALVGPATNVRWTDALTAFVTFYHLLIDHNTSADYAVLKMNEASGVPPTEGFGLVTWKDIENIKTANKRFEAIGDPGSPQPQP